MSPAAVEKRMLDIMRKLVYKKRKGRPNGLPFPDLLSENDGFTRR
jgi:hypothetical protein